MVLGYVTFHRLIFVQESKKHAKLWAFGSFIGGLRNLIGNVPLWEVWLCPASSDGASSAWLKTKFGIDQDRANDAAGVHRIQVFEDISKEYFTSPSSPGLVVFEMSADVQVDWCVQSTDVDFNR